MNVYIELGLVVVIYSSFYNLQYTVQRLIEITSSRVHAGIVY